jgi:hypothetical protein
MYFALIFTTLFTTTASGVLSPFRCVQHEDGKFYLVDQPSIVCYSGEWRTVHLGPILLFVVIYLVFIPLWLFFVILWMYRDFGAKQPSRLLPTAAHLSFLCKNYKRRYFWWFGVEILKRLLLVLSVSFLSIVDGSKFANYLATFTLLIIFLLLDVMCMQYSEMLHLKFSLAWNSVTLVVLLADGVLFKVFSVFEVTKSVFGGLLIVFISVCRSAFIPKVRFQASPQNFRCYFANECNGFD